MALFRVMECVVAFSSMVSTMTLAITYHWWMNLKMFRVLSIQFIACRRLIISMEFNFIFFIILPPDVKHLSQFSFNYIQIYLHGIMIFVHILLINYIVNWAYQNHLMNGTKQTVSCRVWSLITNHLSLLLSHNFCCLPFLMVISWWLSKHHDSWKKNCRWSWKQLVTCKSAFEISNCWIDCCLLFFSLFTGMDNFNCFNCLTKWKVVIAHWLFAYLYFKRIHKSHADKLIASDKKAMKNWIFFTHFHNNRNDSCIYAYMQCQ